MKISNSNDIQVRRGALHLIDPTITMPIAGVDIPGELYWVLQSPAPLTGMRFPRPSLDWGALKEAGLRDVVSLHPGRYDPNPLNLIFAERLQDLCHGGPPTHEEEERARIRRAVSAILLSWRAGRGVVVHCVGGRGRTGTVLGCSLRELGFGATEAVAFLDGVHKARGKAGWPESPWQGALVKEWTVQG